jgi:CubicO group peptidase (beta-lactamase class C family)
MKAIEQGHFTLETNINDILPFKVINPFFPGKPIQVKHLATHTSGIADRESAYKQTYVYEKIPDTDLSAFLFEYLGNTGKLYDKENFVDSEPGATYRYTNIGAALAAYLIEVKTGESFAVYTRKEIFNPLQMNDTHWLYDDTKADKYAKLYNVNKQAYPPYALITYSDGGMRTSSGDLAKYMMEMLKGYSNNSNLLTTQSFTTMFSPQFNEGNMPKNMPANEPNRGVFWAFSRSGRIAHSGGDPGVSAFVSFDPKSQVGRLILINTEIEESKKMTEHFSAIVQILQNFESHLQ